MEYENQEIATASKCDANANLSPIGAIATILDNVCNYFDQNQIDEIKMKNLHNCIWVYTKNKVTFLNPIKFNEHFFVKCFISQRTPVKLIVDVAFLNGQRKVALYAKIEVCVIDLNTQHIRKITPDIMPESIEIRPPLFVNEFARIDDNLATDIAGIVQVKSTNIDYCGHTNNVEYVRFILNTFSVEQLCKNTLKTFEINYVNQTLEGQTIEISKSDNQTQPIIVLKTGEQLVVKCQMEFEK